jgi:hypothetical protein
MQMTTNTNDSSIAEDKISGVKNIAREINESERRTYYLLERRLIPAGKLGNTWIASRSALRKHYEDLTGAAA